MMTRLRSETREEHEAIEKQIDLVAAATDARYYGFILGRFLGFLEPIERVLQGVAGIACWIPDVDARMRTALIRRDLMVLGVSADDVDDLPRCSQLPEIQSIAHAIGCLYVLEGSTLGGQIIARQVREGGIVNPAACNYFLSHGESVGRMWKRFAMAVDSFAAGHPDEMDTVCASARKTFRRMEAWFANA